MYLHDPFLSGCGEGPTLLAEGSVYEAWEQQLQDDLWYQVKAVYGDTVQLNLLRALAIDGIACCEWPTVFSKLIDEEGEWLFIKQSWFEQRHIPDLDWFVRAVARSVSHRPRWGLINADNLTRWLAAADEYECFLPPAFPVWLLAYGYTQAHYIQDLKRYWSDIYPEYYQPWPGTLIGDILSITTIKQLGALAREEIEALFDSAREHVECQEVYPDTQIFNTLEQIQNDTKEN